MAPSAADPVPLIKLVYLCPWFGDGTQNMSEKVAAVKQRQLGCWHSTAVAFALPTQPARVRFSVRAFARFS